MLKHRGFTSWIIATLILAGFIGCGQETVYVPDTARPVVTATTPTAGATSVGLNSSLTATFSKPMTSASINAATFLLRGPGGVAITGTVSYSGLVATFVPSSPLTAGTSYVATITTGATDTASPSNSLLANYVWTFTTVPFPTPPTVISTIPANGAVSVPLAQVLSATFSGAMTASTINANTFKLSGPGGVAVAGAVTYTASGSVASFTPAASLAYSTTYVATITTGAQDSNGTALAANYTWTFTTVAAPIPPAAPVVISTVPANGATGVVVTQAISATFSTAMNAATLTNATFVVTGPSGTAIPGVVSYNSATNTATLIPSANLQTGSTYVATITTGAQSAAGIALASNYVWTFRTVATPAAPTVISTVPANGAIDVPLAQALSATFSTSMNAATLSTATFTLSGPGGTVVPGVVSYNSATNTATLIPSANLQTGSTYVATITTGAQSAAGIALASNYVWTFRTVAAPAAPTVISTIPVNGAIDVPLTQAISATFSTAMNAATLNTATFTLTGPSNTAVPGVVTYNSATNTATFTPSANLLTGSTYVATVTTGAQSSAGIALAGNYLWTFRTVAAPAAPTVISTIPVNGATGVLLTQPISATFSTAMNAATLTVTTFTLTGPSGTVVPGVVTYNSATNTATLTPSGNLLVSSTYVATITTGAQSAAGVALASNYVWTFRTVAAPTPTAPTVIATNPASNAAGVPVNQQIAATFSTAMSPATINTTTFTLTAPGNVAVAGGVTYVAAGSVATFAPTVPLAASTTYVATITTGAQDLVGTPLAANYVWTFTTAAAPDTTRPTVISTNPLNGATNVPFNQAVSATFSEAMDPAKITTANFTLAGPGVTAVSGTVTYATVGNTATFTPLINLLPSTVYTATVTTGVTDLAGNTLLTNYVWTFTTGAAPDTTKPLVILTNPVSGATNVPLTQVVSASFSEAMDPLTITTATFTVTKGGVAIAGTVSYDPINFIATFTPSTSLTSSTIYTATVTTGAQDLAGNSLGAGSIPNPWSFTTGAVVVPPPVNLGTASLFGGFGGGAGMTNMGTATVVNGNIGTTGVSTLITGFHDSGPGCTYTETPLNIGFVNGSIDTAAPPPTVGCPTEGTAITGAIAAQAAADALTAYNALVAFPGGMDVSTCAGCGGGSAGELGNRTLAPGVYKSAPGSYTIAQGDLTLDAQGNPNAFWIFQMATTLTEGTPAGSHNVLLINGAQAKNVYWQVGTAATISGIVGGGTFTGTIISQAGISVSTAGVAAVTTINGRALVITGPVTLVNTVINVPAP